MQKLPIHMTSQATKVSNTGSYHYACRQRTSYKNMKVLASYLIVYTGYRR